MMHEAVNWILPIVFIRGCWQITGLWLEEKIEQKKISFVDAMVMVMVMVMAMDKIFYSVLFFVTWQRTARKFAEVDGKVM